VAYEEDPAKAQALLALPDYLPAKADAQGTSTAALWWPKEVKGYPEATRYFSGKSNMGLMFLHERTTPKGRRMLVCGMIYPDPKLLGGRSFGVRAVDRATLRQAPDTAGGHWFVFPNFDNFHPDRPLRVYAGRADPEDPSHITIEYEYRGKRGVLDGWLRDAVNPVGTDLPVEIKLEPRP
jgi:hypothetical protein